MKYIFTTISFILFQITAWAQTAEELYQQGLTLKTEKKITEALDKFKAALVITPNHAGALYESGWCYNDIKDYNNALLNLSKAAIPWSLTPKVFFERAYANQMLGYYQSSLTDYIKVKELNYYYTNVNKKIGEVYSLLSKEDSAIYYFDIHEKISTATALSTDYGFWYKKGFSHNATKQYEKAIEVLTKSYNIKKDYRPTFLELGFALKNLKRSEEAIKGYEKAIELNPNEHVPYNGIGEVYRDNIKDMDKAIEWYKKALEQKANERKACYGIGYCLNSKGEYSEARTYLKQAIASENTFTAAYTELGYTEYMLGNNTEALVQLNKALTLNSNSANSLYYKGLVFVNQKDKTAAVAVYEKLNTVSTANAQKLKEKIDKL